MKRIMQLAAAVAIAFTKSALAMHNMYGRQDILPNIRCATDARALQYRVMRLSAAQACNVASNNISADAAQIPSGILQNNPNSGEAASIAFTGVSKAWAGGTVAVNEFVTTDGSGMVIEAVSGSMVIGRALESAAVNDRFTVLLFPPVRMGSMA